MSGHRPDAHVPGQHDLGPAVRRFDEAADEALEQMRGHPILDRVFTGASHVGDFSLIWHAINVAIGLRDRNWKRVLMFAGLIGLESLVVNQGIKRLFRRTRPTTTGDERLAVRRPSTSSFPSGHASSATFAAALLAPRTRQPFATVIVVAAGIVATSRAYVRIHHASDVGAGIVTGGILAVITRRLIRRLGLGHLL